MEYFELALSMNKKLAPPNGNQYSADCLNNIGLCHNNLQDYKQAIDKYFDALRIFESVYSGEDHPAKAITLNNIALAYSLAGDFSKSAKFYSDSLEMNRRLFGDEHPSVALLFSNLGGMYNLAKDYPRAIEFYQRALDVHAKAMPNGPNHPDTALVLTSMGDVYKNMAQYAQAVEYYKSALGMYRALVDNVTGRVVQFEAKIEPLMVSVNECYEKLGDKASLKESKARMDNFKKKNYSKACVIS
jgi:tetratricopeptide (TPR) repeat protein